MDEGDMLFSAGWPGHLQRTVEALVGQGVVAMFYNGAQGDQSPVARASPASSNWERAEAYGRELGILVWRAHDSIQPTPVRDFGYSTATIQLPDRTCHPDFMDTGGKEYGLKEAMMEAFIHSLLPAHSHSTSLRLGSLLIVGVPGELSAELGHKLKSGLNRERSDVAITVGGLADEWIGYMLSSEEYERGGYEASMSYYGRELGPTVVQEALDNARALTPR
jgi:hypothetical protein